MNGNVRIGYDGRAVANHIIKLSLERKRPVSNLSVQKILYFCHANYLVATGRPLIRHEFEAWELGPVLQYVYHALKSHGSSRVGSFIEKYDPQVRAKIPVGEQFDASALQIMSFVFDFYAAMPAARLVEISHAVGGPWDLVYNRTQGKVVPGMKIPNASIYQYFAKVSPEERLQ